MSRSIVGPGLALAFALGTDPAGARADRRSFTNTYEYSTVPEGRTAVELWSTQSRDIDRLTAAANVIGEVAFGRDVPATELALGWAAGATYEVHAKCRLGGETWGHRGEGTTIAAAGPAISVAPSSNLWLTITAGFGITDAAAAFVRRALLEIALCGARSSRSCSPPRAAPPRRWLSPSSPRARM